MSHDERQPRWRERLARLDPDFEVRTPADQTVSQDQEWVEVAEGGESRRVRIHDYDELYAVPGLYEAVVYEHLQCCSPGTVVDLLIDSAASAGVAPSELRVLDVGAGNGMVGDELAGRGVREIVGVDIVPEAREATLRDRPDVYDEYLVTDLTALPPSDEELLRSKDLNGLVIVGALGFGDVPPAALVKAMDVVAPTGWMAFNIHENFLEEEHPSGFSALVRRLESEGVIDFEATRRYRHRVTTTGEPIHYLAVVARRRGELPDEVRAENGC